MSLRVAAFEFIYLTTLDLGHLLKDPCPTDVEITKSHQALSDRRAARDAPKLILDWMKTTHGTDAHLGDFCSPENEGDFLAREIQKAEKQGAKRIFTFKFLHHDAPLLLPLERPPHSLFDPAERLNYPDITANEVFRSRRGNYLKALDPRLRIFQNCSLGIEMRIAYGPDPNGKPNGPLTVPQVIEEIQDMEEMLRYASFYKLKKIFEDIKRQTEHWNFTWKESFPDRADCDRLSCQHSILLLDSLLTDEGNHVTIGEVYSTDEYSRAISGLLNKSAWYEQYWSGYLKQMRKKFVGFQSDELFVTDKRSSLFYYPQYWNPAQDQFANKKQFINNFFPAIHYLLSWEAMAGYYQMYLADLGKNSTDLFRRFEAKPSSIGDWAADLGRLEAGIRQFIDALTIGVLTSHGFTTRILEQYVEERGCATRVKRLAATLDSIIKGIGLSLNFKKSDLSDKSRSFQQKLVIAIALVALVVGTTFQVLNYYFPRNVTNSKTSVPTVIQPKVAP